MGIIDVIERARKEPPYLPPATEFPENFYTCEVRKPTPWDRKRLEKSLGFGLPDELVLLWNACDGLNLYCDTLWCPSGLIVSSPSDGSLQRINEDYLDRKADRALFGDLIIAEVRSDLELVLIRCDKSLADYSNIIVVTEMGPRDEWETAASSLEEFLVKYMDAHGDKFWEYHYKRRQAERAAQQNPEGKESILSPIASCELYVPARAPGGPAGSVKMPGVGFGDRLGRSARSPAAKPGMAASVGWKGKGARRMGRWGKLAGRRP